MVGRSVRLSSATTQCTKLRFDNILSGENLVHQDLKICGLEMCRPHRYVGFSWTQNRITLGLSVLFLLAGLTISESNDNTDISEVHLDF